VASKRDLVEAYSYNRRRLVTAFLSGAPGGREVEPSRQGKAIFAGVVLAALVVGAGAMAGEIEPTVKDGWDDNSLVIAKKSGARYVALDKVLYPVANTTSARLLADPGEFKVVFAPEDRISDRRLAEDTIGIAEAPDSVPRPDDLISSGWVSCADRAGGTSMRISETPTAAPVANQAVVARTAAGDSWVVAGEHAYKVDKKDVAPVLRQLELAAVTPFVVPATWIAQFPDGGALTPLRLGSAGGPSAVPGVAAGDVVVAQTATGPSRYVALPTGVAPLTAVQFQMYKLGAGNVREVPVQPTDLAKVPNVKGLFPATIDWPADVPAAFGAKAACAVIHADGRSRPVVQLAQPLDGFLAPTPAGAVQVDAGHGALVRSTTQQDLVYLIDSAGRRYQVGTGPERVQLGFGKVLPTFMPDAWFAPLQQGPALIAANATAKVTQAKAVPAAPAADPKPTPKPAPSPAPTGPPGATPKPAATAPTA
jgi:type VII secretion protein EccB